MEIVEATRAYEAWLGGFMPLVRADLRRKHALMSESPFLFLRATFYRWGQVWRALPREDRQGRVVLAVGDLHLENFGTWRDTEGRLVWGINDFDEAVALPWTQDLLRLTASAHLAITEEHLSLSGGRATRAILDGYHDAITGGGEPFVLEESNGWLRQLATGALRNPGAFWLKLMALPSARKVPGRVGAVLRAAMSSGGEPVRIAHRVAGVGSLGRPRFVAIGQRSGGAMAREAKAAAPSAWTWGAGTPALGRIECTRILSRAVRAPDPTVRLEDGWLVRRLAPHCTRIELTDLPSQVDEERLLHAMGFETGNIHLGTPGAARSIAADLGRRPPKWMHRLAERMVEQVRADWRWWRRHHTATLARRR